MNRKIILFGLSMFDWPAIINDYEITSIPFTKRVSFCQSLYRALLLRTKPAKTLSFFNVDLIMRHINEAYALIIGDGLPYEIFNEIVKIVDKADKPPKYKIFYLINPARDLSKLHITDDWKIKTFDFNDHKKWGCKYVSTFHVPVTLPNTDISSDIFFVGKNKGRFKTIMNLEKTITDLGFKCKFLYVSKLHFISKRYSQEIPYSKVLSLLSSSRAILDVSQDGQMGLTQRFMESIFYKKKIITNNKDIKKYKIYNDKNIYILSEHNTLKTLVNFLSEPYEELNPSLVCWYNPQHWLSRMLSEDEEDIDLIDNLCGN